MILNEIQAHVDTHLSPLAWKRVIMRLLPQIRDRGFFMHTFKGEIEIDEELVQMIDDALIDLYNEGLPTSLKPA